MGWKVDSPGVPLTGGSLVTKPAAREEALFPAVPKTSGDWARACAAFSGAEVARLELTVTADGAITAASALGEDQRARCIADRAKAGQLRGVKLPSETQVSLRMAFKKPS